MSEPTKQGPNTLSLPFVEALYADYLRDSASVPPAWREYFSEIGETNGFAARPQLYPSFPPRRLYGRARSFAESLEPDGNGASAPSASAPAAGPRVERRAAAAAEADAAFARSAEALFRSFRARGHLIARIDPLGAPRPTLPDLKPEYFGFTERDLDRPVADSIAGGSQATLRQVLDRLRRTYCGSVGVQFLHIEDTKIREWLQDHMERAENRARPSREEQLRILQRLTEAAVFEEFIQKKYIGSKSFSVEGSETLIALLDLAIDIGAAHGLSEIVLGMAHRGRLNVLANILGKPPRQIFREFEDADPELYLGQGDVKYHLGYSVDVTTASGHPMHLSLCYNPSHLEYVNPVALGRMRAKQDRVGDEARERGMVLLIHGDAAFAGEGVVQEVLNMSQLRGYKVGGTLHVIVNNQIGFTTPPEEGRSTPYATDVARMLQVPIFHVNGEDPEAVASVVKLSLEFRRQFKRDVVIDLYGYRRHGHNEGDEPAFTQPELYREIARRKPVHELYREELIREGRITQEEADEIGRRMRERLEEELAHARNGDKKAPIDGPSGIWKKFEGGPDASVPEAKTGVDPRRLREILESTANVPEGFHPHPKIKRGLEVRRQMARGEKPLDWSAAEAAAFGALAIEGSRIRLSGQDTARGTFSQRHAVLHDVEDGHTYVPLQNLSPGQAPVEIINSPLSEVGVLGFEFGYSIEWPDGLIAWEAQFGDFVNAAQVIIDQFLAGSEEKWRRLSGLVLLLPHGLEGMGSEHSSARLERFLDLAARDNLQVVYPSTPAQYFHCLRRQVVRPWRKPLVVMTPKSLLRHPACVSPLEDLARGRFERVLPDATILPAKAKRVLLCTGKIYYELLEKRQTLGRVDTPIARLEQLYPLPEELLRSLLDGYPDGTPVYWVQEEPENMGAWRYIRARFGESLFGRFPLHGISRPEAATPASGALSSHKVEQERLLSAAFGGAR
ncbi:MAG: 2-oxoglutarate dehydrogenase E1 component [Candidatus Eisenbacteria bacterium]|uniref:oxoglutarate dehydrogenase (succinyl-transferring) n=1 Tax=Eiseniibacteriota bacterium TaxID=2212470 RepID=A0A538THK8_UNCEI|nr:MAG: 2-oxoglutarate dehydrogenase E1 component [Candidatus Eisenbacteria bacterium]